MDWSADTPYIISQLHVPPSGHEPSSHVPMPQGSSYSSNVSEMLLDYGNGQPADTSSWDRAFQMVLLFGTKEALSKDATNIHKSLVKISNYIKNHSVGKDKPSSNFIPVIKSL